MPPGLVSSSSSCPLKRSTLGLAPAPTTTSDAGTSLPLLSFTAPTDPVPSSCPPAAPARTSDQKCHHGNQWDTNGIAL
jgi:hypothetical protein